MKYRTELLCPAWGWHGCLVPEDRQRNSMWPRAHVLLGSLFKVELLQVRLSCPSSSKARPATLQAASLQGSLLFHCQGAALALGAICAPGSEVEAMPRHA